MTLVMYDVENIKTSAENNTKKSYKFDFFELKKKIEELVDDVCVHVAFLTVYNSGTFAFTKILENAGIEVIVKKSVLKNNEYKGIKYKYRDNDTDALIVFHMIKFAPLYDTVVLVSGDKDLAGPFKSLDKQFKIAIGWENNLSLKMKNAADEFFYLEDLVKPQN